jgi:hypothetical protein
MKSKLFALLFAMTGLGLASCDGSGGLPLLNSRTAQLNIQLTDEPFPFSDVKSVDIFVVRIDAKTAETAEANDAEAEDLSETSDWETLVSPNASFNLLNLTNGKTANLGVANLPPGTYRSFRLVIDTDKSSITLNDDTKPDVKWPAAGKVGIKILLDKPVVLTETSTLLIDFDVGRSFVMRGNSISQNGLLFKPVIHATSQQSTASIAGSVRAENASGAGVAGATVEVLKAGTALDDTNNNNVVRTGVTDGTGAYTLAFVPPGTYVVRATPPAASGYKPALLTGGVTVAAGDALTDKVIVVVK